jgi:hypothetical protein
MKKFFIALIGGTVVLIGIALLVLPGPGLVIIAAGLAILATEFLWARRMMHRCRATVEEARQGKWKWFPWLKRRTMGEPAVKSVPPLPKPQRSPP